ncbi:hypothetical protein Tcan_02235 [Toxocara canis]|uniref:Uncharacterized protein n=1 Tax=Toxocara canis TaxID=6265 RepID=A0A0B2UQ09_TOXCA|nr:hypothetical protein Tcan_02235 [Toxocara canis]
MAHAACDLATCTRINPGFLSSFDSAKDPVPAVYEKPTVCNCTQQPKSMSVLQTEEMHRSGHVS